MLPRGEAGCPKSVPSERRRSRKGRKIAILLLKRRIRQPSFHSDGRRYEFQRNHSDDFCDGGPAGERIERCRRTRTADFGNSWEREKAVPAGIRPSGTEAPGKMSRGRKKEELDTGQWAEVIQAAERLLGISSRRVLASKPSQDRRTGPKVGVG